jgi:endo-1,4-beta-D-glucanase Y
MCDENALSVSSGANVKIHVMVPVILGLAVSACPASDRTGNDGGSGGPTGAAGITDAGTGGREGAAGRPGTGGSVAGTSGMTGGGHTGSAGRGGSSGVAGTTGSSGAAGNVGSTGAAATMGGGSRGDMAGTAGIAGAGGQGGTTGSAGAGGAGTGSACNAGLPSAPTSSAHFPFPQHRASTVCIYPPVCSDDDAVLGWQAYKAARIVLDGSSDGSLRVMRDPSNNNDTYSESIGYGMLFAVYMNEKTTFDNLWKYEQKHLDPNGLMNWHVNSNGTTSAGENNSATDGDEDMAFALLMADKQWTGYTPIATKLLTAIVTYDFATDGTVKGGDTYTAVDPSYLAPAYYRAFAAYSGDARWTTILEKSYATLNSVADQTTGLVPDWSSGRANGGNYTYDATRTPFRVALDACWNKEPRAIVYSQRIGGFFAHIGAANIVDGYMLDGAPVGANHNSSFVGPAGAAGMAAGQASLVADVYTFVALDVRGANTNYYDGSWALFTTLLMTGNFVDFAAY